MTEIRIRATAELDGTDGGVRRLACHPRLPLVACLEAGRSAVHVWEFDGGRLRALGSVGADAPLYGDLPSWERCQREPVVAWHPHEALLFVADENGVRQWTPTAGAAPLPGVPAGAVYRSLAVSPEGDALWASPSARGGNGEADWGSSDVLVLSSGRLGGAIGWDTGVVEHPGSSDLSATLTSDQGATLCLFARSGPDDAGAGGPSLHPFRRALILDCDGYSAPLFSPDGRHLVFRGSAYDNSVWVYAFPSLRRVFASVLGEPNPGYPAPPEWHEQLRAWPQQNLAFAAHPGILWIAAPEGALLELELETQHTVAHDVLAGSPVQALTTTADGDLLAAVAGGGLALLSLLQHPAPSAAANRAAAEAAAAEFLASTTEAPAPDDGGDDLEQHLVLTDGIRTWTNDDLSDTTTADATDPTWLQITAAVNQARAEGE